MTHRDARRDARQHPEGEELAAPDAVLDHYRSVDSAPVEYSLDRPPRVVNGFLVSFLTVSLVVLLAVTLLAQDGPLGDTRDIVFFDSSGDRASIPVRLFILIFFAVFSLYLGTNAWRRLRVLVQLCGGLLLGSFLVDACALAVKQLPSVDVAVVVQQVIASVIALALFPVVILRNAHLPDPVEMPATGRIGAGAWLRYLVPAAVAVSLAGFIGTQLGPLVDRMRDIALLGGVGPGVFLVQQLFVLIAGGAGMLLIRRSRRAEFAPALVVLVPAHNEAHLIAQTIAAVDRAAAVYPGSVRLNIVDNVSTDDTVGVARRALEACSNLQASLMSCLTPGKANALNYGLDRVREHFVVRIDADAVIGEKCLTQAMRHFADARVGAVGGLPLPAQRTTFMERVRLVEVLVRHGFFQVSRMGYDGVVGVPGMFTAFRYSALLEAGPVAAGMNGEDTDMCLRLNSLGYRCLVEPAAEYTTETPRTWAHLREQRTRWFRSTYHVAGHNRRVLLRGRSMAGTVVMPIALFNSARRAMLAPILIFALLVLAVFSPTFAGLRWQPVVAMVVGVPGLVAIAVSLLLRRPRAVLCVPEYLVFRILRSYYTLAALLSLRFEPLEPPFATRRARGDIPEQAHDDEPGRARHSKHAGR